MQVKASSASASSSAATGAAASTSSPCKQSTTKIEYTGFSFFDWTVAYPSAALWTRCFRNWCPVQTKLTIFPRRCCWVLFGSNQLLGLNPFLYPSRRLRCRWLLPRPNRWNCPPSNRTGALRAIWVPVSEILDFGRWRPVRGRMGDSPAALGVGSNCRWIGEMLNRMSCDWMSFGLSERRWNPVGWNCTVLVSGILLFRSI